MNFFGYNKEGKREAILEDCSVGSLFRTRESFESGGIHVYIKALAPTTLQAAAYGKSLNLIYKTKPLNLSIADYRWLTLPYPEPFRVPPKTELWLVLAISGKVAVRYDKGGKGLYSSSPMISFKLVPDKRTGRKYSIYDNVGGDIDTDAATSIGADRATLNGHSHFGIALSCEASFLYDTSHHTDPDDYPYETSPATHQVAAGAFSFMLGGLLPNTTYYFIGKGVFDIGPIEYGGEESFTTLLSAANILQVLRVPRVQTVFLGA